MNLSCAKPNKDRPSVVLVQPRIPQNVGAIARVCAATNTGLHIVRPIPFELSDKSLKRAGMDYLELLPLHVYTSWEECKEAFQGHKMWFLTSAGKRDFFQVSFSSNDVLVFGSESAGLPKLVPEDLTEENAVKLPMAEPRARCLNLATSAAISVYEVLRQTNQLGTV